NDPTTSLRARRKIMTPTITATTTSIVDSAGPPSRNKPPGSPELSNATSITSITGLIASTTGPSSMSSSTLLQQQQLQSTRVSKPDRLNGHHHLNRQHSDLSHDGDIEDDDDLIQERVIRERARRDCCGDSSKKWWEKGRLKYFHYREVPRYMQDNPCIFTQ
ncbi:hypothetical protein HDU76_000600, partial [Blyttiomyces sp. JEL0837]